MLLNFDPSVRWFAEAWSTASEIRMISGRLAFTSDAPGGRSAGNNKPQGLLIWRPDHVGPPAAHLVHRDAVTRILDAEKKAGNNDPLTNTGTIKND